jgi:thiol:disulfide interchange protein
MISRTFRAVRCLLLPASLAVLSACAPGEPPAPPETGLPSTSVLIDLAGRAAAVDDRVVMVKFRASWCEWCARLDAALHSFELGRIFSENYVLLDLTVQESDDKLALETPGAQAFMDSLGAGNSGLPFYVFLDPAGKPLADSNVLPHNIGYPVSPEEIDAFVALLEATAPRMTAGEKLEVANYLTTHAP